MTPVFIVFISAKSVLKSVRMVFHSKIVFQSIPDFAICTFSNCLQKLSLVGLVLKNSVPDRRKKQRLADYHLYSIVFKKRFPYYFCFIFQASVGKKNSQQSQQNFTSFPVHIGIIIGAVACGLMLLGSIVYLIM